MTEAPRTTPSDIDIEQSTLGACIVDPPLIESLRPLLTPDHFHDPLHRRLYGAMLDLSAEGAGITPLTIASALRGDPGMAEVGGHAYLGNLAAASPAMANVRDYARILIDLAIRRGLISAGAQIMGAAHEGPLGTPILHQINTAEREIEQARDQWEKTAGSRAVRHASEIGDESLRQAEDRLRNGEKVRHLVTTGLYKVDEKIGGYAPADLILIAGRPGQGKSTLLALNAWAAAQSGHPTLVFSKEMRAAQWVERTQCDIDFSRRPTEEWPIHYYKFRTGTLSNLEIGRLAEANRYLADLPLEICDDDDLSIADITARARAFRARHHATGNVTPGLIVVDYLQIIDPDPGARGRSREQEVGQIARGFKSLAKRLDWPVVAGAQLNRQSEKREESDRRPTLGDLRESGSLEQEADIVIAPYRKAYYIRKRKPEDVTQVPAWQTELAFWEHKFEAIGLKFRHGSDFTVDDLYCDMGASAIRDEAPNNFAGLSF